MKTGITIFFTGLSGSGKSTLAKELADMMKQLQLESTILDGDIVRSLLCSELGFSKKDRDLNIRRIGYVASQIVKFGGIAICAAIAPYDEARKDARTLVEMEGGLFLLVHLSTSLEACEKRDVKGLYQKARSGEIKQFTGISDPYEIPVDADMVLDTAAVSVEQCVYQIFQTMCDRKFKKEIKRNFDTLKYLEKILLEENK